MRLISFAGVEFTGMDSSYEMSALARVQEMQIAGGNGAYDLTVGEGRFDNQTYEASFSYVEGCSERGEEILDQLRGAMMRSATLIAEFHGARRRVEAKLIGVKSSPTFAGIHSGIHRVALQFRASPFWYDDALAVIEPVAATTMLAVNGGNAVSRSVKFAISPAANVANLTLTAGSVSLTYGAALLPTDVLVIDAANGTVTKNGTNAYGNTTRPDTQMALFELAKGKVAIVASSAVTGRVEYRGCWV